MKVENLNDLFVHTLKDIYFAERQIVKALPKMVKAADSKELAKALEDHLEETKEQVARLEQVFKLARREGRGRGMPGDRGDPEGGRGAHGARSRTPIRAMPP